MTAPEPLWRRCCDAEGCLPAVKGNIAPALAPMAGGIVPGLGIGNKRTERRGAIFFTIFCRNSFLKSYHKSEMFVPAARSLMSAQKIHKRVPRMAALDRISLLRRTLFEIFPDESCYRTVYCQYRQRPSYREDAVKQAPTSMCHLEARTTHHQRFRRTAYNRTNRGTVTKSCENWQPTKINVSRDWISRRQGSAVFIGFTVL